MVKYKKYIARNKTTGDKFVFNGVYLPVKSRRNPVFKFFRGSRGQLLSFRTDQMTIEEAYTPK